MAARKRISQVHRRKPLETPFVAAGPGDRTAQAGVGIFAPDAGLDLQRAQVLGQNRVDRIDVLAEIRSIVNVVAPVKRFRLGIPELHFVLAVLQVRVILVTGLDLPGFAVRQHVVQVSAGRDAVLGFPGAVPLARVRPAD